jgi:hypothetical protein
LVILQCKLWSGQGVGVGLEDDLLGYALGARQSSAKDADTNQTYNEFRSAPPFFFQIWQEVFQRSQHSKPPCVCGAVNIIYTASTISLIFTQQRFSSQVIRLAFFITTKI